MLPATSRAKRLARLRPSAAHSLSEVDGHRQRQGRAHRLPRQREVGQVELLDDPDDRGSQRRLLVAGAGGDVRPAHAREVDRVDRERVGDLRDDELEVVELCAHRVHQDQGLATADAQVADARAAAQHDVADLPAFAPCLRVVVRRFVDSATSSHSTDSARRRSGFASEVTPSSPLMFFARPTVGRRALGGSGRRARCGSQ
jgi:hypothetical protein